MALAPQTPVPHSSFEAPRGPEPLSGFGLGVAAATLAVASIVATICKEIAARWRGIVVAHLFFLTLWMAIQVFFFATGAYWCLPSNSSRLVEWLTRSFARVARCGPVLSGPSPFQGSIAIAAPGPAEAAPLRPIPSMAAAVPASPKPAPAAPAPASGTPAAPAPPAAGSGSNWSAKAIANCWRNRSVDSGECYEPVNPTRRPPPPPPRYRYRYPDPQPLRARCRHPYDCWPNDEWSDNL